MIGLSFLAVGLLWLALAYYLTANLPLWLGLKKLLWPARVALLALLLVGPFVDEIVGMRQFRALCEERTAPRIAPGAQAVDRTKVSDFDFHRVRGLFIEVQVSTLSYSDVATGRKFLEYDYFKTKGGRIAGLALLDGWHSCSAGDSRNKYFSQIMSIPAYKNFVNGVEK